MASSRQLAAKILNLENFQNLAKSIQMIAIANVHKLNLYISSRDFSLSLSAELFRIKEVDTISKIRLYRNYTFVILTSEKNCCGKLNSDILRTASSIIDYYLDNSKNIKIISIGWRCRRSLSLKYKSELYKSFIRVGRVSFVLSYVVALCVFDSLFDVCKIIFSKYNKLFEQIPCCYDFISYPLCYNSLWNIRSDDLFAELLLASQNDTDSMFDILHFYFFNVCLVLLDSFFDHLYSEFGCRAFSMEISYINARELLKENILLFNKARQWSITAELLDLISGTIS